MQNLIKSISILSTVALLSFTAAIHGDGTYKVDTSESNIEWVGKKFTGEHSGNLALKSGQIVMGGHGISSAKFIIDMTTIKCTDMTGESASDLESHLRNEDFFSTEKHPTAIVEMIKAEALTDDKNGNNFGIKANLTIKGITNEVSFPAQVNILDKKVELKATITFDRTKWNIKYKSKTIFPDLGDKFIYDEIDLNVSLLANLQ